MDERPIAVFDSGLGGLTALRALVRALPGESFVYFGDTARVPYGGRSRETLLAFARQNIAFLRTFDPKAVVVACGTLSTVALDVLREECDVALFGVVLPAVAAAVAATASGKIGVIGTQAAIDSGVYQRRLSDALPGAQIHSAACPRFVPLVEDGHYRPDDPAVAQAVADHLTPLRDAGVDTLVLGCTHYPLLRDAIAAFLGPQVRLIDAGAQAAHAAAAAVARSSGTGGTLRGFVSGDVDSFTALAHVFLDGATFDSVAQVALPNSLAVVHQTG